MRHAPTSWIGLAITSNDRKGFERPGRGGSCDTLGPDLEQIGIHILADSALKGLASLN